MALIRATAPTKLLRGLVLSAAVLAGALAPVRCLGETGRPVAATQPAATPLPAKATQALSLELTALLRQKNMPKNSPILLRIFKEESELEVWKQDRTGHFELLKTYPICKWSGDLGPKMHEGDRQAPEGFYTITPVQMNPNSNYYLAINTGFPNSFDKANDRDGTFLMIHGNCASIGCYAMTDDGIADIYALAREAFVARPSFQVQAYPFRMTPENLARHRNSPNLPFWMTLKIGNDHFEATHLEPKVDVCDRGYVFDAVPPNTLLQAFDLAGKCPAIVVDPKIAHLASEKQRADAAEYAQLVEQNVPTAPVYSGLDGGMNKVFDGRFPGAYVSFAKVLPNGPVLPQLPPVPFADNSSSLTSRFFGGLIGSKPGLPAFATSSAVPD
jgi:murein L,D-transpeptidase YafK